jgi:hypothetical protein
MLRPRERRSSRAAPRSSGNATARAFALLATGMLSLGLAQCGHADGRTAGSPETGLHFSADVSSHGPSASDFARGWRLDVVLQPTGGFEYGWSSVSSGPPQRGRAAGRWSSTKAVGAGDESWRLELASAGSLPVEQRVATLLRGMNGEWLVPNLDPLDGVFTGTYLMLHAKP